MLTRVDEQFLPPTAQALTDKALKELQDCTSPIRALNAALHAEDVIDDLHTQNLITDAQAKGLYLVFEAALETGLSELAGKEDTPRQFP